MSVEALIQAAKLTPNDYASGQEVRWCPGCGDYAILAQVKKTLASLGLPREKTVFISGIGCSSRFPYYVNTYGIHGIHGRAPAIATGLKCARPDLSVWVITGDGDALSIGGNHLLHVIRRNVDINILLFNNRIYGLTKGQSSPTTPLGHPTKSNPFGTLEHPVNALSVALGCEATFVARSIDIYQKHLGMVLERAVAHKGTSFVEIYQNCVVFFDGAWEYATDRQVKDEHILELEHGKPMLFGKNRNKGIRFRGCVPEIVELGNGVTEEDVAIHDEKAADLTLAFVLSRMRYPEFPEPIGVLRCVEQPTFDGLLNEQVAAAIASRKGPRSLDELFREGDTWVVSENGQGTC